MHLTLRKFIEYDLCISLQVLNFNKKILKNFGRGLFCCLHYIKLCKVPMYYFGSQRKWYRNNSGAMSYFELFVGLPFLPLSFKPPVLTQGWAFPSTLFLQLMFPVGSGLPAFQLLSPPAPAADKSSPWLHWSSPGHLLG